MFVLKIPRIGIENLSIIHLNQGGPLAIIYLSKVACSTDMHMSVVTHHIIMCSFLFIRKKKC
jgi:hypothetical protein